MSVIAVITGDIVNSSELSAKELSFLQENIIGYNIPSIVKNVQFYRGDSFQLAVEPVQALWLAIKYRTGVKRWKENCDIRISIGIAGFTDLNDNVLISSGKAFEISGKNLDSMKNSQLNLAITTTNQELNQELETYCFIIDMFLQKLTVTQSSIIHLKLDGIVQKEIGKILNITQPAVSKGLSAGNWMLIEKILIRYKYLVKKYYGLGE